MLDTVHLQPDLQLGELLEWTGRPHPRNVFTSDDVFLIPFHLRGAGFLIFWLIGALRSAIDPTFVFTLWGVTFLPYMLYLTVGRFLHSAWERRYTWYGVTNQRILIVTTTVGHRVTSYYYFMNFNTLPMIETRISASGRGTLLFRTPRSPFWSHSLSALRPDLRLGFYDIPDARYVFDLISWHLRGNR